MNTEKSIGCAFCHSCDRNVSEFKEIIGGKTPDYLPDIDFFLDEFQFELIPAVDNASKLIRDAKDQLF